jgi:hypothetical protein
MITQKLANSANVKESAESILDKIEIPKDILPQDKKVEEAHYVVFKLVKKKSRPGARVWLDNFSEPVPNPENNNIPERLCLLQGATDVWESKCENIIKDKNRYDRARRGMDIVFVDSVCRVRSGDVLRLKYMRLHPKNVGDKRTGAGSLDFYEYNPAREQEDRLKKQILKIEIVNKVMSMDFSENGFGRKLASFVGIGMNDQELGLPKTAEGIKTELAIRADNDPVTIQKYLNSNEVEVSWLVRKGIMDAKIDLGGQSGNVTWSNGKGFIAKIPSTRKPLEYLLELAMTNSDEGRKFLEQLKTIVG